MKLVTNEPGRYVYAHGDGRAIIEYRRSGWDWSVAAGGREVAFGRVSRVNVARVLAAEHLRAASNAKEV